MEAVWTLAVIAIIIGVFGAFLLITAIGDARKSQSGYFDSEIWKGGIGVGLLVVAALLAGISALVG